jgi:diguanylate cyclase (GGDEF)-like protein
MPRNPELPVLAADCHTNHDQRIRLLLRTGVVAAELLAIGSWLAIHLILNERLGSAAPWGTLSGLVALFLLHTFTESDRVWRYTGLMFLLVFVLGYMRLFEEYPLLHAQYALPFAVLTVVGASLLIRGPLDYLVSGVLTWVLIWPATGFQGQGTGLWYLELFVVFSLCLGWVNNRSYIKALQTSLDIERHYRRLAETDHLTSLLNRRALMERFEAFVASRPGGFFLMIDMDDFKRINDRYGHGVGDQVLCALADCLRAVPGSYCSGRLGGEEFGVVIDTVDPDQAQAYAERLLEAVRGCDAAPAMFTFSAGLVPFFRDEDPSGILTHADRNLYKAKHAGKNRVQASSP